MRKEPYWTYTYTNIEGLGQQKIELYKYSAKCIALKSSQEFGRSFSKQLKAVGGRYNANLKFDESDPLRSEPGWIFKIDAQNELQKFISSVQKGESKPRIQEEKTEKQENVSLFRKLKELVDLLPEDGDDYILSEANGYRTYITFGLDKPTEDNCVYSVRSSHKKLDVYQIKI